MADADDVSEGEEVELGEEGPDSDSDVEGELADEECVEEDGGATAVDDDEPPLSEPTGPDTSVRAYRGHTSSLYAVDADATGALVCTGSGDDSAHLFFRGSAATVAVLRCRETVSAVAFSLTGRFVATGSYDSIVRVWDAAGAAAAASSAGGAAAAAGTDASVTAVTAAAAAPSPMPLHELDGPGGDIEWLRWHPKGDVLLAGCSDGTCWMWSINSPTKAACMQVFAGHDGGVPCGMFTTDGKAVLTGGEDGTLRLWSPKTGACTYTFTGRGWCTTPLTIMACSPLDPHLVCVGCTDGTARLVNISARKAVYRVDHNDESGLAPQEVVEKLPVGGGSSSLGKAAGGGGKASGEDGDEEEDEEEEEEEDETSASVESISFCEVMPWLATGATNGSLVITDISTSSVRHRVRVPGGCVIKLVWLPRTTLIALAMAAGHVIVLDARDASEKARFTGHAGMVMDLWVARDCSELVTAGDDGVARVYSLADIVLP